MKSKSILFIMLFAVGCLFGGFAPDVGATNPELVKRTLKFAQPETQKENAVSNQIQVATPDDPDEVFEIETKVESAETPLAKYDPGWQSGENLCLMNPNRIPLERQCFSLYRQTPEKPYVFKSKNPPRNLATLAPVTASI